MAVSKNTRSPVPDTNDLFQFSFRHSQISEEREREWKGAVRPAGTGTLSLRPPVYERLYFASVPVRHMADLLKAVPNRFAFNRDTLFHHQSLIRYLRAAARRSILDFTARVEHTEIRRLQCQLHVEKKKYYDPDKIYSHIREHAVERILQRPRLRIEFFGGKQAIRARSEPDNSG